MRDLTIEELMDATECAYMRSNFGDGRWRFTIIQLRMAGYTGLEIQAILRSKYVRWANDSDMEVLEYMRHSAENGSKIGSKEDIAELIDETPDLIDPKTLA